MHVRSDTADAVRASHRPWDGVAQASRRLSDGFERSIDGLRADLAGAINGPWESFAGGVDRLWEGFAGAVTLLTIVPLPIQAATASPTGATTAGAGLNRSAGWLPIVGAALGALAGGVRVLCEPRLGRSVSTVLATVVLVVATGALHQDGLADTADGLGARGGRTRRLEAMRDSATGVFGVLALLGWTLLLLTTMASLEADRALGGLIVACALARWAALLHAAGAPPARSDGLGMTFGADRLALSTATGASVILALGVCGSRAGAAALGTTLIVAALSAAFARRTLGGRTGDTLGATVAVVEVAVCVVLVAVWHG